LKALKNAGHRFQKIPEDYLCEEEDAASLLKIGSPLRKEPTIKELARSRESGMIDFQSALKAVQNQIAPQEFVSIRGEIRSVDEGSGGAQWCSARHFAAFSFYLEGVSEAEIDLHKVVRSPIRKHITGFAEESDVWRKAIFESKADMAEYAIRSKILT
jgi:hypothetical protein